MATFFLPADEFDAFLALFLHHLARGFHTHCKGLLFRAFKGQFHCSLLFFPEIFKLTFGPLILIKINIIGGCQTYFIRNLLKKQSKTENFAAACLLACFISIFIVKGLFLPRFSSLSARQISFNFGTYLILHFIKEHLNK